MGEVSNILSAIEQGDPHASAQLLPLVYNELRKLARMKLAREKPGQMLQTTALVHEAYLRLADGNQNQYWNSRGHFFAAAAEAMRRILVENARQKGRAKHGGGFQRTNLDRAVVAFEDPPGEILALDDALERLSALAPAKAEMVRLRFYAGLSTREAADVLGISLATAERHWTYARCWLFNELSD